MAIVLFKLLTRLVKGTLTISEYPLIFDGNILTLLLYLISLDFE